MQALGWDCPSPCQPCTVMMLRLSREDRSHEGGQRGGPAVGEGRGGEEDSGLAATYSIVSSPLRPISPQRSQLPGHTAGTAPGATADFL